MRVLGFLFNLLMIGRVNMHLNLTCPLTNGDYMCKFMNRKQTLFQSYISYPRYPVATLCNQQ